MGRLRFRIVAALVLMAAPAAQAAPLCTADHLVRRFSEERERRLGPSRCCVCIGTEAECPREEASPTTTFADCESDISFDHASDALSAAAKRSLDEIARALQDVRLRMAPFHAEGYTDARGRAGYNLNLSQRRARNVVSYLAEQGVDRSRMTATGHGKARPKTANPFEPANRRVEVRLFPSVEGEAAKR